MARIETTEAAVEAAPEAAAVKAAPEAAAMKAAPEAAVKAAPESTAAKTAGLGSSSADRGSKRESNYRSRQQQLAGHETLLLTFLIRFHRIAGMCADNRPKCLFKTDGWLDGIKCGSWRSGIERLDRTPLFTMHCD
jgi:hypothetical protein